MSSDGLSDFGFYGITGASLSLMLAGVKDFEGPIAGVRIASDEAGNFVFDPNFEILEKSHLDLTVAGTTETITMVESQGKQVSNDLMVRAFEFAHSIIQELAAAQNDFIQKFHAVNPIATTEIVVIEENAEIFTFVKNNLEKSNIDALYGLGKIEFHDAISELVEKISLQYANIFRENILDFDDAKKILEENSIKISEIADAIKDIVKSDMREKILSGGDRLDGRKPTEVRTVTADVGILPRTHGSGIFERGVTQVLSVATLGGPSDIQIVDDMYEEDLKRYIHHYNFPPYSVGDVRPLRGVGRREVGHGRLAEKALEPVLPSEEEFPYMIRVVSETITCNGSSSMASVCGSSLSLMDAGVPITDMVAGVAMGMIYDENSHKYVILSDIQAQEDFLGDMDFKVARTEKGITALQMDCKISGLSMDVIRSVLSESVNAISYIIGEMQKSISAPRAELSPYAPFLLAIFVPEDKMREVIGKGGETIQGIEKNF